jgi:1,4-alpha-glucan branching enzyme
VPDHQAVPGSFALVLHSHIPYVLAHGRWPHGMDWLSEVTAESYIPLLDVFHRLVSEGISPRVTIGLTPVLVEQLADETFAWEFEDYCSQKINIAEENGREFRRNAQPDMAMLADYWRGFYSHVLDQFRETYGRDLVGAFRALQDAGHIEILTSAATHGYFPLLGTDAAIDAQVKQGAAVYRRHFGRDPRGFWLPECAYRPSYHWQSPIPAFQTEQPVLRKGVEEFLAENGIEYFFVDSHLLKGGEAVGVYAERFKALEALWSQFQKEYQPETADRSPYQAYLVNSSGRPLAPVAIFARDHATGIQVWSGEVGYPGDEWYLEFHRKHYPGNLRYWRVSWPRDDLGRKELYEPVRALSRLPRHARNFAELVRDVLKREKADRGEPGVITAMYDTELYGHWWFEGPEFLYYAIRALDDAGVRRVTCGEHLDEKPPNRVVSLPEGSWGEGGYHWIWLNEWTTWTWELIYKAEREMAALAAEFGDEPRVQTLLKQAGRELLLLESSDWQFSISTWASRDYAEQRVNDHAGKFETIASLIRRIVAGEEIPADDWNALGEAEDRDRCFPDVDPRWWVERQADA